MLLELDVENSDFIFHQGKFKYFIATEFYYISLLIRWSFSFQNNHKNLDPSYKMDLDLWDFLERVKLIL